MKPCTMPRHRRITLANLLRGSRKRGVLALGLAIAEATALALVPPGSTLRAQAPRAAQAPPSEADEKREFERLYASWPRFSIPVQADGAAVVVVKFADYQCPPCATVHLAYRPVFAKYQARYPGAVKLVAKDYPLEPECNPNVVSQIHPTACDAAVAVRLARQQGKAEALEEWFYGHQEMMTPQGVRDAARLIGGVAPAEFDANYQRVLGQVKADVGLGHLLTVTSTPTLFVNGTKIPAVTADGLDLAIELEMRKVGRIK